MNPKSIACMWALTMLMAGAIALGPIQVYVVAALIVVFTLYAIL